MAAGTRYDIVLCPSLRNLLTDIAGSRVRPVREVRNARILLARAARVPLRELCPDLHCSSATVVKVCRLFRDSGWPEVCRERPRGRPRRRGAREHQRLVDLAQSDPQASGLPLTTWSLSGFQTWWCRRLSTPPPARSTLHAWLHAAAVPWFRFRSWCTTNDPHFQIKCQRVTDAYLFAPDRWAVLCYDQMPNLQALARRVDPRWPCPGQPGTLEHDYLRRGTLCLHTLLDVRTGRCRWACRDNHTAATIADLFGRWLADRPEQQILLVMDNLSANHAPPVQALLDALGKLVLVFRTPTHSSWLNQVERVFADLHNQLLRRARAQSVAHLAAQIGHWFRARNPHAKPYQWTFELEEVA